MLSGWQMFKTILLLTGTFMRSLDVSITGDLFPADLLTHLDSFLASSSAVLGNTPFTSNFMLLRLPPSHLVALLVRTQAESTLALLPSDLLLVHQKPSCISCLWADWLFPRQSLYVTAMAALACSAITQTSAVPVFQF